MSYIRGINYKNVFEIVNDFPNRYQLLYSLFFTKDNELMSFIKSEDEEKYNKIVELPLREDKPDLYLFNIGAILNPHADIFYHGYHFSSYEEIGKKIIKFAPKIDVYLLDLITEGLVLDHMKRQGVDRTNPPLFNKIEDLTKFAKVQPNIAYFRFGFYFNGVKNIHYGDKIYDDYKCFVSSMYGKDLTSLAESLETNGFIIAWQISSSGGDLSIYRRFRHTLEIYNEKKIIYEKELSIENKE